MPYVCEMLKRNEANGKTINLPENLWKILPYKQSQTDFDLLCELALRVHLQRHGQIKLIEDLMLKIRGIPLFQFQSVQLGNLYIVQNSDNTIDHCRHNDVIRCLNENSGRPLTYPVNTALRKYGKNDPLEIIDEILGEDRAHTLQFLCQRLKLKLERIIPTASGTQPKGTSVHMLPLDIRPRQIKCTNTVFNLIHEVPIRDSSGNSFGLICYFSNKQKTLALPFSVVSEKQCFGTRPNSVFKIGLSDQMYGFYNRNDIRSNPNVTLILTTDITVAEMINHMLSRCNERRFLATAWFGGKDTLSRCDFTYISKHSVLILTESDGKFKEKIASQLKSCNSVNILQPKAEITNLLELLDNADNSSSLLTLLENCIPYQPPKVKPQVPDSFINGITPSSVFSCEEATQDEATWDDMIRKNLLTLIYGATEVGKSYAAHTLSLALADGKEFLSIKSKSKRNVLYIDGETAPREATIRSERLKAALGAKGARLHLLLNNDSPTPIDLNRYDEFSPEELSVLKKFDVIIIDNILSLCRSVISSGSRWNNFLKWCKSLGVAIVLVHHPDKGKKELLGVAETSALTNTLIRLSKPEKNAPGTGAYFKATFEKCKADGALSGQSITAYLNASDNSPWQIIEDSRVTSVTTHSSESICDYAAYNLSPQSLIIIKMASKRTTPFQRENAEKWISKGKSTTLGRLTELIEAGLIERKGHFYSLTQTSHH